MLHRILWAGALAGLASTTPLAAQQRSAGPSFGITPYAGYMKFGNLVSGPLRHERAERRRGGLRRRSDARV